MQVTYVQLIRLEIQSIISESVENHGITLHTYNSAIWPLGHYQL